MIVKCSIRSKLLAVIIIVIIPLVVLRGINIAQNYKNNINNELQSYKYLAQAISSSFTNYIEEIWALEGVVGTYLKEHRELSADEISEYLSMVTQKQGDILRMCWMDPQGKILASSDRRYINASLSNRGYITQINNGKEKVISDLVTSLFSPSSPIIPVARASYDDNSNLTGIVVAVIDTTALEYKLPCFGSSSSIQYMLIDSKGKLVYSNKCQNITDSKISMANGYAVQRALQGYIVSGVKVKSEIDGSEKLSIDYPITELGWDCRVSSPYHIALSSYYRQLWYDTVILALVTLISMSLAWFMSSYLLRKISSLRIAAKRIMEGDYSARTNIKGNSEIELAAEAFDKMAESIEHWHNVETQFFTNISHELKTPVNVIFSSVQLIENYKDSLDYPTYQKKVSTQMKLIRQNCYRIIRIISNLIDISRHDSGFLKGQLENYDIVKLIRDITFSVQKYVETKGIELRFSADMDSRIMACDPDMLERIMLNLISNAIKFTDRGGTITVGLQETINHFIISVRDTGIGIPKEKLNIIFDRFNQASDHLMRNSEGSGIGLSLVKAFVEAHGGTISASSEVNKGTVFYIALPIRLAESQGTSEERGNRPPNRVDRINIEFSDIYSVYDEGPTG